MTMIRLRTWSLRLFQVLGLQAAIVASGCLVDPGDGSLPASSGGSAGAAGASSTGSGGTFSGGLSGTGGSSESAVPISDVFEECRFHFGMDHNQFTHNPVPEVEYLSAWAGSGEGFNLGAMFVDFQPGQPAEHMVPVLYGYVIAFTARRDQGLCDCNVNCPQSDDDLCSAGAQYVRDHLNDRIIPQYRKYAEGVKSNYGTEKPVIWLMEPDYYQYATPGSQSGNPLTFTEAGEAMTAIVAAVREILPNAVFSLDISPWMSQEVFADWISHFNMSDFTFMNTSGGATRGDLANIRAGQLTWQFVSQATGKPIFADASYCGGTGCQGQFHDDAWDDPMNLNARIADGVMGVTHVTTPSDWSSTLMAVQPQLDTPPHCP